MKLQKYVRQPALTEAEKQAQSHLTPHEYERKQALLKHQKQLRGMQHMIDRAVSTECGHCHMPFLGKSGGRCQCPAKKPQSASSVQ